jgi:2-polyprenyl-6-methoxyphenol hydroxylase-like FAD-dependent oxidoreductase
VLSDHFDRVTIIEKDRVHDRPESRPGQPHTRHLHGLLATGLEVMSSYFPDLPQALVEHGAVMGDPTANTQWYTYGGYRQRFVSGLRGVTMSRPLLEYLIRERVLALPQVKLIDRATVKQLVTTSDRQRVIAAIVESSELPLHPLCLSADLIVDATGRNSATPKWLADLGYTPPQESEVEVNVGYATRLYHRDPNDPLSQTWFLNTPEAPQENRFGAMLPIEGDRWIVSVGGWHGDSAPTDEAGFLEFVRHLPSSDIYDLISQAEPLSDIIPFKFPANRRRHYERLSRFPAGYLVLGDAVCTFNPTYGQGMTVAALEARELDRILGESISLDGLAPLFFRRITGLVDISWQMAVGEDFRYPQTAGIKPLGVDILNCYVAQVHRATLRDRLVGEAFVKVMNLIAPPVSLFHPQILWHVLTSLRAI